MRRRPRHPSQANGDAPRSSLRACPGPFLVLPRAAPPRILSAFLPEWLVQDLKIMYGFFQERGLQAAPEEIEMQRRLLAHDPRAFETFV